MSKKQDNENEPEVVNAPIGFSIVIGAKDVEHAIDIYKSLISYGVNPTQVNFGKGGIARTSASVNSVASAGGGDKEKEEFEREFWRTRITTNVVALLRVVTGIEPVNRGQAYMLLGDCLRDRRILKIGSNYKASGSGINTMAIADTVPIGEDKGGDVFE